MYDKQEHKAFVESIAKVMKNLPRRYNQVLNSPSFNGHWCEQPEFSVEDYQEYTNLLKRGGKLPKTMEGLKKATLIGANKVFGVLEKLYLDVRSDMNTTHRIVIHGHTLKGRKLQGAIDLRLSNDSSLRADHPEDPNHYSYKDLYLGFPGQDTIFLRAASTYDFGGLSALNNGKGRRIRTTRKRLINILETFSRLHKDVNEGKVSYNINLPYSSTVSLKCSIK